MLPGNAKCSMTSLADTKIYIHEKIYGASNFAAGYDHARLADYSRFPRDEIIKSLRLEQKNCAARAKCISFFLIRPVDLVTVVVAVAVWHYTVFFVYKYIFERFAVNPG